MEQLTVGQRIDVFEITADDYYKKGTVKVGVQRPAISVDKLGTMLFLENTVCNGLYFIHKTMRKEKSDCKKVGTLIIKSLK